MSEKNLAVSSNYEYREFKATFKRIQDNKNICKQYIVDLKNKLKGELSDFEKEAIKDNLALWDKKLLSLDDDIVEAAEYIRGSEKDFWIFVNLEIKNWVNSQNFEVYGAERDPYKREEFLKNLTFLTHIAKEVDIFISKNNVDISDNEILENEILSSNSSLNEVDVVEDLNDLFGVEDDVITDVLIVDESKFVEKIKELNKSKILTSEEILTEFLKFSGVCKKIVKDISKMKLQPQDFDFDLQTKKNVSWDDVDVIDDYFINENKDYFHKFLSEFNNDIDYLVVHLEFIAPRLLENYKFETRAKILEKKLK